VSSGLKFTKVPEVFNITSFEHSKIYPSFSFTSNGVPKMEVGVFILKSKV